MFKNKIIGILAICLIYNSIFSSSLINEIKVRIDSLKTMLFKKDPYKELCKANLEIITDHTLDNVIGMEKIKEELKNTIKYIINPKEYAHIRKPETLFLLHGWARTGKTFLVDGFVGSAQEELKKIGKPAIKSIQCPPCIIMKYGISAVLKYIQSQAPVIIYIDEVDFSIGLLRNTNKAVFSDFLTGLISLLDNPEKPIICFLVTNKIENIPSLGNFGTETHCEYPNFHERKECFAREFKRLGINLKDIDFDRLARQLDQVSYEKINYILHTALMKAGTEGAHISQDFIEKIINTEFSRIIKNSD